MCRAAIIISVTIVAALTPAASEPLNGATQTPERTAKLERLIRHDCGSCHGMTLKGGLGPDITAQALAGIDSEAITQIILEGVPGTPMPPWRPLLSEQDARWIAAYLLKGDAP